MKKILKTRKIPVWDCMGNLLSQITLPEDIIPAIGRRGGFSDSGLYYKGAGTVYEKHLSNLPKIYETVSRKTGLVYQKYAVINRKVLGKFGIFTFFHQPAFSDLEGGCGPKENKLIENFKQFDRTSILEITNVMDTCINDHKIYVYRTKDIDPDPFQLPELIEYILTQNWNTAYDKDVWSDIVMYGYVRDIADWFISSDFSHKIGTIYGLLTSLYTADKYTYTFVLDILIGCNYFSPIYIPYLSALIVQKFCPDDVPDIDLENLTPELYEILLFEIYQGRACCHLECEDKWAWVKSEQINQHLNKHLTAFKYELFLSGRRFSDLKCLHRSV